MPAKKSTTTSKTQGSARGEAKTPAKASAKAPAKTAAKTTAKGSARKSAGRQAKSAGSQTKTAARGSAKGGAQTKRAASSTRSGERLIDHATIQQWAEERGAHPACVRNTGGKGDVGMIRLDFPGYSGEDSLEPIEWDEWFQKFDENNLALVVQQTTRGQKSNFNKLVRRTAAESRPRTRGAH